MTSRSSRKILVSARDAIRDHGDQLTREMRGVPATPLLRARNALTVAYTELCAALREHDEQADAERTPVRPPSQANLAAARGLALRVDGILKEGKQ